MSRLPRVLFFALLPLSCGRVSFIADGQVGDAGRRLPSDAAFSSSFSSSSSSSSSGTAGSCAAASRPPQPVFEVLPSDVTTDFSSQWSTRNCAGCHGGPGALRPFSPPMPANPSSDPAAAALSLSTYCRAVHGAPPESLAPDAGAHDIHLLCVLLAPAPAATDPCNHGAGDPANDRVLSDVQPLAGPCFTAFARHRESLSAWAGAGIPDAGCEPAISSSSSSSTSSTGGANVDCPRADLDDEFDAVWQQVGPPADLCLHCHNDNIDFTPPGCFVFHDRTEAHERFCAWARQSDGAMVSGGWQTSRLYLATHNEARASLASDGRFACEGVTFPYHQDIFAEGGGALETSARAWYDAIFVTP